MRYWEQENIITASPLLIRHHCSKKNLINKPVTRCDTVRSHVPEREVGMKCTQLEVLVLIWRRRKARLRVWRGGMRGLPQAYTWKQPIGFLPRPSCHESGLIILSVMRCPWNGAWCLFSLTVTKTQAPEKNLCTYSEVWAWWNVLSLRVLFEHT